MFLEKVPGVQVLEATGILMRFDSLFAEYACLLPSYSFRTPPTCLADPESKYAPDQDPANSCLQGEKAGFNFPAWRNPLGDQRLEIFHRCTGKFCDKS